MKRSHTYAFGWQSVEQFYVTCVNDTAMLQTFYYKAVHLVIHNILGVCVMVR